MITSPDGTVALSNLGWVDKGAVWRYDARTGVRDALPLWRGDHVRLSRGRERGLFTVDGPDDEALALAVLRWDDPAAAPIAAARIVGGEASLEGEPAAFERARSLFVRRLPGPRAGYHLIRIDRDGVRTRRLDWFDDRFDHAYQSVMSVLELPDGRLLFGVQRSSQLVLCDAELRELGGVQLAGRGGNPDPFLRGGELWAVDYDTLVAVDARTLVAVRGWRGQGAVDGMGAFIGNLWMPDDESAFLVARPYSGDVVALDPASLMVGRRWELGRQPLDAAIVGDRLVARDWMSGELLLGEAAPAS